MKNLYSMLFIVFCLMVSKSGLAQMSQQDSVKVRLAMMEHRNDSIRKAHKTVVDSFLFDGKYYPITSTDLHDHEEKIEENDLVGCESDSLCGTIKINRKEAEKVEIDFPTNKLSGKISMYKGFGFSDKALSSKFSAGEDYIDLKFTEIEDGAYTFKLERSDKTYIFRLVIKTVKFW